jgi:hypothetical protein
LGSFVHRWAQPTITQIIGASYQPILPFLKAKALLALDLI